MSLVKETLQFLSIESYLRKVAAENKVVNVDTIQSTNVRCLRLQWVFNYLFDSRICVWKSVTDIIKTRIGESYWVTKKVVTIPAHEKPVASSTCSYARIFDQRNVIT